MPGYELALLGLKLTIGVFAFAFGACAGSLINVLVYRMPRGMGVVTPPSRCPACGTRLTGRENVPILGWLALGGKCRFCRSRISAEYPLVETLVASLFALLYALYYALPQHAVWLGVDWGQIRPDWALADLHNQAPSVTWPVFIVHVILVGALVAMTLVDAKTFTIPLGIPWSVTGVALVFHTLGAVYVASLPPYARPMFAPGAAWALPTPGWPTIVGDPGWHGWWWIGASLGGVAGLGVGMLLLHRGLIRRSFEDYNAWEREALKARGIDPDAPGPDEVDTGVPVGEHVGPGVRLVLRFVLVWFAVTALAALLYPLVAPRSAHPWLGLAVGAGVGSLLAALACRPLAPEPAETAPVTPEAPADPSAPSAPELWIAYPHARREMLKELIFLTPCLAFGWGGAELAARLGDGHLPPLWLLALCGSLLGYLIGGGAVWAIRIFGSLAFGKEAMGLGDVHLMAAVGACLGWVDAVMAIPLAAVVALWFVVIAVLARRPAGRAMPFGPYLAVATFMVMMGKPLIERGLTALLSVPGGAPINLP
jgi:prepilin signal peptidase PulO-like enzyme (type II secretory pathway)